MGSRAHSRFHDISQLRQPIFPAPITDQKAAQHPRFLPGLGGSCTDFVGIGGTILAHPASRLPTKVRFLCSIWRSGLRGGLNCFVGYDGVEGGAGSDSREGIGDDVLAAGTMAWWYISVAARRSIVARSSAASSSSDDDGDDESDAASFAVLLPACDDEGRLEPHVLQRRRLRSISRGFVGYRSPVCAVPETMLASKVESEGYATLLRRTTEPRFPRVEMLSHPGSWTGIWRRPHLRRPERACGFGGWAGVGGAAYNLEPSGSSEL